MQAEVFWISEANCGPIAVMPRPRGGDWLVDELESLRRAGVDVLVSLLTPEEETELELQQEALLCSEAGMQFISFPIEDRAVPSASAETEQFIESLGQHSQGGLGVAIHCRMGVGRAALIAAAVMISHGHSVEDAFDRIRLARGFEVPDTIEQRDWVVAFAERFRRG